MSESITELTTVLNQLKEHYKSQPVRNEAIDKTIEEYLKKAIGLSIKRGFKNEEIQTKFAELLHTEPAPEDEDVSSSSPEQAPIRKRQRRRGGGVRLDEPVAPATPLPLPRQTKFVMTRFNKYRNELQNTNKEIFILIKELIFKIIELPSTIIDNFKKLEVYLELYSHFNMLINIFKPISLKRILIGGTIDEDLQNLLEDYAEKQPRGRDTPESDWNLELRAQFYKQRLIFSNEFSFLLYEEEKNKHVTDEKPYTYAEFIKERTERIFKGLLKHETVYFNG